MRLRDAPHRDMHIFTLIHTLYTLHLLAILSRVISGRNWYGGAEAEAEQWWEEGEEGEELILE